MLPEGREGDFCGELSYATVFARALFDPDLATPAVVAGPKSKAAVKRYNVYRNNVTVSLVNARRRHFRRPCGSLGSIFSARWRASMCAPRPRAHDGQRTHAFRIAHRET
jgi:hypothetical protein